MDSKLPPYQPVGVEIEPRPPPDAAENAVSPITELAHVLERYVGWGCIHCGKILGWGFILNYFMLSSLPCFADLTSHYIFNVFTLVYIAFF